MLDMKMDGHKPAPAWFWISLALLLVGSIIAYIIFQNDRERNQFQIEKKIAVTDGYDAGNIYRM